MTETLPKWVEYRAVDGSQAAVRVERITADMADTTLARGIARLTRDAYAAQFGDQSVPAGVILDAYDPDDPDVVSRTLDCLQTRMDLGRSHYWIVRGSQPDHIVALGRVSKNGETYLGDLMVDPTRWRQSLGSTVLHAALKYSQLDAHDPVAMHAFEGSSVNNWYYRLGFEPRSSFDHFRVGNTGFRMLMRRMALPGSIGLRGLLSRLEQRHSHLRSHHINYGM